VTSPGAPGGGRSGRPARTAGKKGRRRSVPLHVLYTAEERAEIAEACRAHQQLVRELILAAVRAYRTLPERVRLLEERVSTIEGGPMKSETESGALARRFRPPSGERPCSACPFRRQAPAGWLGRGTPQSFIVEISMERPLPCHPTIDYEDPRWSERWTAQETGKICAGSLILAANMGKVPRDPAFPRLPPNRAVFKDHLEFIRHHEEASVRSWEMGSESEREARGATATKEESESEMKTSKTSKRNAKNTKSAKGKSAKVTRATRATRAARAASKRPAVESSGPSPSSASVPATPVTTPQAFIERVRRALQLRGADELSRADYAEALQELRGDIDGMIEAALQEETDGGLDQGDPSDGTGDRSEDEDEDEDDRNLEEDGEDDEGDEGDDPREAETPEADRVG
jgi:hypothetical protein